MRIPVVTSYSVSEDIRVRSEKTSSTLSGFDSLPQTKKMITMKFSWAIVIKRWCLSSASTWQCVSTDISPLPTDQDSIVDLNIDQLVDSMSSHRIMNTMARSWSLALGETARQRLIEYALEKARETLNSIVPRDHDRLYLDFRVVKQLDNYITDDHGLDDDHDQDGPVEESNDESNHDDLLDHLHELEYMSEFQIVRLDDDDDDDDDNGLMIRTDESSIESLEKKTADGEGSCVVCMEDHSSGIEVVCMPCSHAFHEGCIKKWLKVSHYCPICRFEMPTISSDHKA